MFFLVHSLVGPFPKEVYDPHGHKLGVAAKEGKYPSEPLALLVIVVILHVAEVPGAPAEGVVDEEWDE